MNFDLTAFSSSTDMEKFFNTLYACANEDYDGFIFDFDASTMDRVLEIATELQINWITAVNICKDENGAMQWPGVSLNSYQLGQKMANWLDDNYTNYWGDIDKSKLGLISIGASDLPDFIGRGMGAFDTYEELYPDIFETNSYYIDVAGTGYTADAGYDRAAAVLSAHPDIEYWFISCCMELQSLGAARAAESLGKDDSTLIICVDGSALMEQWDNGYEGCWVAGVAIAELYHAMPTVCGLVAMIDGRVEPDNLWPDFIAPGDHYAERVLETQVLLIDNYKQYYAGAQANYDDYLAKTPQS